MDLWIPPVLTEIRFCCWIDSTLSNNIDWRQQMMVVEPSVKCIAAILEVCGYVRKRNEIAADSQRILVIFGGNKFILC